MVSVESHSRDLTGWGAYGTPRRGAIMHRMPSDMGVFLHKSHKLKGSFAENNLKR